MTTEVVRSSDDGGILSVRTTVRRTVVYISHRAGSFRVEKYRVNRTGLEMFCGYADVLPRPDSWQEESLLARHMRTVDSLCGLPKVHPLFQAFAGAKP